MPQLLKEQSTNEQRGPSPELFFDTANAYQRSAALRGAVDLELFTAIGEGRVTAKDIAARCQAQERGVRILCDYLVVLGFLTKSGGQYGLTPDSSVFLDKRSPAYVGGALGFLNNPGLMENFSDIASVVRKGGTLEGGGTVSPENPVWVEFARAMRPLIGMTAEHIARHAMEGSTRPIKVLDIAGGHGIFGIEFARQNPAARVVLQDWASVAAVARENAERAGVLDRFSVLPGSAFEVDFGTGYDLILLTNFLHHFDPSTIEHLLRKVRAALGPDGRALTLEFVPEEDRVSPPIPASFSLVMLASTPSGEAYTFREFQRMFTAAGFTRNDLVRLPASPQTLLVSYR